MAFHLAQLLRLGLRVWLREGALGLHCSGTLFCARCAAKKQGNSNWNQVLVAGMVHHGLRGARILQLRHGRCQAQDIALDEFLLWVKTRSSCGHGARRAESVAFNPQRTQLECGIRFLKMGSAGPNLLPHLLSLAENQLQLKCRIGLLTAVSLNQCLVLQCFLRSSLLGLLFLQ